MIPPEAKSLFSCWEIPKMQGSSDITSSIGNRPYTSGAYEQYRMRKWLSSLQVLKAFAKGGYSLWSTGVLEERAAREKMYNLTSFAVLKYICKLGWRRCKAENLCDQNKGNILELQRGEDLAVITAPIYWGRTLNQALFGHFAELTQPSQLAQELGSIIIPHYRWSDKLGNLPRIVQLINLGNLASIW